MKKFSPTTEFVVPPENGGQIVTESYALDQDSEVIIVCSHDGSTGKREYTAFEYPDDDESWEPWNAAPSLGKRIGRCKIS